MIVNPGDYIRPTNKHIVAISGCFDIIHIGHIRFIEAARGHGDTLVVLVESDRFIETYKKRKPFHTQQERAEILSHLREVDQIVLLPFMDSEKDYAHMWATIKPSVIAITGHDPYIEKKQHQASLVGARLIEVTPLIEKKSTTNALKTIQATHA